MHLCRPTLVATTLALLFLSATVFATTAAAPAAAQESPVRLQWTDCPFETEGLPTDRLRCGSLVVPEDWADRDSRPVQVAFALVEAKQPSPASDAILYLPGGPGGSDLGPGLVGPAAEHFAIHRDFVAVDVRGSGHSDPVLCPALAGTVQKVRALDLTGEEYRLVRRGAILGCRGQLRSEGVDLASYNATAMAADVDALREALGYEQWNLFGVSAGTRIAQILMRDDPATIRSAVLNSPSPIDVDVGAAKVSHFMEALDRLFDACAEDVACKAAFPTLRETFHRTYQALREAPLEFRSDAGAAPDDVFVFNGADFVDLVHSALFRDAHLPHLPAYIRAANQRDTAAVRALVERFYAPPDRMAAGLYYAATCHDDFSRSSGRVPDDAPAAFRSFFDHQGEACALFHPYRATEAEREPVEGDIPTLIRSGPFDPATPPTYGDRIARGLQRAHHVLIPASSHNMNGGGVFCLASMMQAFWNVPESAPPQDCVTDREPLAFLRQLPDWAR